MQSPSSTWFQERFGNRFELTMDKTDDLRNDRTGYFIATSIEGSGTGFGGDICVGDDLLSAQEARSKTIRDATNHWLDDTFRRRLNNPTTGVFVHVSQRLADDDPTGHLLEKNPSEWIHVKIKREAEDDEVYVFPLSGRIHKRPKGDILQPERCPPHVLSSLKAHSREWAGQEQQEPAPSGGIVFNPNWWNYYNARTPLPSFNSVVLSVDCAFKGREDNDYVAIHKWADAGPRRYLLNRKTEHLGYVATKAAIKAELREQQVPWCLHKVPRASILIIEDKANGSAVIEELRRDPEIAASIIAIEPHGGKDSRGYTASADAEAGNVYLPEDAPWIGPFVQMFSHWSGEGSIPHDDDIDAASQYLNWARDRIYGLALYYEAQQEKLKAEAAGISNVETCIGPSGETLFWDDKVGDWVDPKTGTHFAEQEEQA
jgi:predicted phage terminase large subunit-like protein